MKKISLIQLGSFITLALVLGVAAYVVTTNLVHYNQLTSNQTSSTDPSQEELVATEKLPIEEPAAVDATTTGDVAMRTETKPVPEKQVILPNDESKEMIPDSGQRETVTLAGGCFWCTEAYLQETNGVVSVVSGYAGGAAEDANYRDVSRGGTEHREAVQVVFDPARINFAEILEVYWRHIDPVDEGGQFADRGFHYTTAIYYHTETQRQVAENSRAALQSSGLFDAPVATEVLPYTTFFEAEEYHQDFYLKSSDHYERYKEASGRAGFIDDNWAREAARLFFETQAATEQTISAAPASTTLRTSGDRYIQREWTESEIQAGLEALSPEVYQIVALAGTEPRDDNEYNDFWEEGIYVDVVTGEPLYSSTHKYESGSGWPAFHRPITEANMIYKLDFKLVLPRTEVRSQSGHLGHVFNDGPEEFGGKRHCINSLAMNFVPRAEMAERGYSDYLYLFE